MYSNILKHFVHLQLLKGIQCSKLVCEKGNHYISGRYIMTGVPFPAKMVYKN